MKETIQYQQGDQRRRENLFVREAHDCGKRKGKIEV
jgi:hypothetical protein